MILSADSLQAASEDGSRPPSMSSLPSKGILETACRDASPGYPLEYWTGRISQEVQNIHRALTDKATKTESCLVERIDQEVKNVSNRLEGQLSDIKRTVTTTQMALAELARDKAVEVACPENVHLEAIKNEDPQVTIIAAQLSALQASVTDLQNEIRLVQQQSALQADTHAADANGLRKELKSVRAETSAALQEATLRIATELGQDMRQASKSAAESALASAGVPWADMKTKMDVLADELRELQTRTNMHNRQQLNSEVDMGQLNKSVQDLHARLQQHSEVELTQLKQQVQELSNRTITLNHVSTQIQPTGKDGENDLLAARVAALEMQIQDMQQHVNVPKQIDELNNTSRHEDSKALNEIRAIADDMEIKRNDALLKIGNMVKDTMASSSCIQQLQERMTREIENCITARIQGMNSATTQLFLELRSEVTEKVMAMERRLGAAEEQMESKASTRGQSLPPAPAAAAQADSVARRLDALEVQMKQTAIMVTVLTEERAKTKQALCAPEADPQRNLDIVKKNLDASLTSSASTALAELSPRRKAPSTDSEQPLRTPPAAQPDMLRRHSPAARGIRAESRGRGDSSGMTPDLRDSLMGLITAVAHTLHTEGASQQDRHCHGERPPMQTRRSTTGDRAPSHPLTVRSEKILDGCPAQRTAESPRRGVMAVKQHKQQHPSVSSSELDKSPQLRSMQPQQPQQQQHGSSPAPEPRRQASTGRSPAPSESRTVRLSTSTSTVTLPLKGVGVDHPKVCPPCPPTKMTDCATLWHSYTGSTSVPDPRQIVHPRAALVTGPSSGLTSLSSSVTHTTAKKQSISGHRSPMPPAKVQSVSIRHTGN